MSGNSFKSIIDDLRGEFLDALKGHHAVLREAQAAWEGGNASALDEIRLRAHRIAGVAGLFQAEEIGNAAEAVERAVIEEQPATDISVKLCVLLNILPPLPA